ncbi:SDR family NAD(P)-dependent oxidoreductase [Aquisalimonas lutea]|uniref:SDR family oxidoreductase n=1 Tax=Aquisalimonas lutea TaxID=1327750 RepID=UPI0025B2AC5C|nr:SDR family NAD(P)-dependent oxidoreductase [Aquisalimonas lutea]MDN3519493.1 SDR family NAD(P)-dependent oxidoreductase [Aquisalimonas lutea]
MTARAAHAIVTGAGRGIGAAIAARLAAEGFAVHLAGRTAAALEAQAAELRAGGHAEVHCHALDVTDAAQVEQLFTRLDALCAAPAVVVNNAGISGSVPFHRMEHAHWQSMFSVNVDGVFHVCRAAVPRMREAGYGRIVNVASTAGLKGYAYVAAYVSAKHAVIGLTRALALECARSGITVNAVCPGFADTDMTAETVRNIVDKTGRTESEALAELTAGNPQGRLVQPGEVADAVAWLAGEGAGAVTGQSIAVAGGEVTP